MEMTTADIRIRSTRPLISPAILEDELPLTASCAATVQAARRAVAEIITRKDDRLLAIVGPCSVHDPAAALKRSRQERKGEAKGDFSGGNRRDADHKNTSRPRAT